MNKQKEKKNKLDRRHKKIRMKIVGISSRPRLNVFRSNKGMYLQLIDDSTGKTLVSVNSKEVKDTGKLKKVEKSFEMGKILGERALKANIKEAVFDRGGYKYHGRVKAVAEGAREAGLKF
ncbi:50S ribosomal protein L18 [Candidatus Falkowbacteria bacterium HGW-Falkowbacteria-1]|uniref:Large ribosomal subunit protein uL18 n=1 Tax=Candidatus Falkowbacteria bacterium HGW-Falkowbacteria-1 TaxID=2013768 RepID=A0A2N2E963_9BACT|nr:MAG: 50S ribosomal protein L18 [Candidatus Falkowbacteria bacterium HGW-Falkowbacteria-1]